MAATKDSIRARLNYGKDKNYSHMLMVCDTFDYEDYSVYVPRSEKIEDYKKKYQGNMQRIMEVYNYDMDLEYQLSERRAWHEVTINIPPQKTIVDLAEEFATNKHKGQRRKNVQDYISHPISVAQTLMHYKKSHNIDNLMAAAMLHDVIEDTDTSYYELVEKFGHQIASLVMEVTTNKDMKNAIGKEKYLAYKLKHMTSWGLVIKLCDRLDNISDLNQMNHSFRTKYVNETSYIINYIYRNRELSETHLNIIQAILLQIKQMDNSSKKRLLK
jgi:(p)ppGpp synthase/HD superfamily hydrolase